MKTEVLNRVLTLVGNCFNIARAELDRVDDALLDQYYKGDK